MRLEDFFPKLLSESTLPEGEVGSVEVWLCLGWPLCRPRPPSNDPAGSITVCNSGASLLELNYQ